MRPRRTHLSAVATVLLLAGATSACQGTGVASGGSGGALAGVSRQVHAYCISHGYSPAGSANYEYCTVHYSIGGNRQDLDARPMATESGL